MACENEFGVVGYTDMDGLSTVTEEENDNSKGYENMTQEVEEKINEALEGGITDQEVTEFIKSADEGTMTELHDDGKKDGEQSASENKKDAEEWALDNNKEGEEAPSENKKDEEESQKKDGEESATEKKVLRTSNRRSIQSPLMKQIKQEVIEEIITNETPTGKSNRRVNNIASKKMKLKREKLLGPSTNQSETTDPPDTIDVTCGHLRGILHKELFYCPGIHRACVEVEDGTFVTPKRFMFMGEKARLKDWKNAIRWNGHQLRKHIEAGTLSFYKHEELCTGRCMARSPFAAKEQYVAMATDGKLKNEKFEFETLGFSAGADSMESNGISGENLKYMTTVEENGCMKIQSVSGGDHSMWGNDDHSHSQDGDDEPPDIKPDVEQLQMQMMKSMQQKIDTLDRQKKHTVTLTNSLPTVVKSANYSQVKPYQVIKPAGGSASLLPQSIMNAVMPPVSNNDSNEEGKISIMNAVMPPVSNNDSNEEEDRLLWQGIVELGLVDEFFREIKASLDLLKNTMVKRLVPIEDSNRISTIVRQLGLMQKLKFKLEAHKTDMDRQRRRLDREMMDLQRRVKEYEHKKKLLEKKSECFDQILEIPTMKNNSPIPMMVYPNQQTPTSQQGAYVLSSSPSSSVAGTAVPANGVLPSQVPTGSKPVTNMVSSGRITTGPGGSKILVFPKQGTEFYSSPEGGLKITVKRKQEFPSNESPAAKQTISESKLKDILTKNLTSTQINSHNASESETSKDDANNEHDANNHLVDKDLSTDIHEEHNSSYEELNSSHEDNTSAHSGSGDQEDSNPLKRSKRKRSAKSFADYIS